MLRLTLACCARTPNPKLPNAIEPLNDQGVGRGHQAAHLRRRVCLDGELVTHAQHAPTESEQQQERRVEQHAVPSADAEHGERKAAHRYGRHGIESKVPLQHRHQGGARRGSDPQGRQQSASRWPRSGRFFRLQWQQRQYPAHGAISSTERNIGP